ncbi:MAG: hypothetical protein ABIH46_07485 [Chloroflexota bacterium]
MPVSGSRGTPGASYGPQLDIYAYATESCSLPDLIGFLGVNAGGGPITITIFEPGGRAGKRHIIVKTDSSANAVTIRPKAGTIDGQASLILSAQYDSALIISTGSEWLVIGSVESETITPPTMVLTTAGAIIPAAGGAEQAQTDGTNFSYYSLNFDQTTEETAYWQLGLPDAYAGEDLVVDIYWLSTVIAGGVVFDASAISRTSGETWDSALTRWNGTQVAAPGTAGQLAKSIVNLTGLSAYAAKEALIIALHRDVAAESGGMAADAKVVMVVVTVG